MGKLTPFNFFMHEKEFFSMLFPFKYMKKIKVQNLSLILNDLLYYLQKNLSKIGKK